MRAAVMNAHSSSVVFVDVAAGLETLELLELNVFTFVQGIFEKCGP